MFHTKNGIEKWPERIDKNVSLSLEANKDLASKIMNAKFHNIENHTYRIRHIVREINFEPQSRDTVIS